MTDIIDKVAEALAANHYSERFGKPKDDPHVIMNAESQSYMFRIQATAALEALAEGLVWKGNYLHYKSASIGHVYRGFGGWWWESGTDYGNVEDKQRAKTALLNHARRVLFGLGPVGEDG